MTRTLCLAAILILAPSGSRPGVQTIPALVAAKTLAGPTEESDPGHRTPPPMERTETPSAWVAQRQSAPPAMRTGEVAGPNPVLGLGVSRLTGVASWYRWRAGEAAAGPALRRLLGPHWRGAVVTVCRLSRCIRVRLTDYCGCYGTRLIDLDGRSFAQLGPLSRGLLTVRLAWR